MMDSITNHAYRALVDERIHQLLVNRRWYRARGANWDDLRKENEVELRALVRLARKARQMAAAAPDPMDAYKSADEAYGFGDDFNIEGQPEFNGAFR